MHGVLALQRHTFESMPAERTRPSGQWETSVTHSAWPYCFV